MTNAIFSLQSTPSPASRVALLNVKSDHAIHHVVQNPVMTNNSEKASLTFNLPGPA